MGFEFLLGADLVPRHLISPNIHVIFVHFPLGIFVFGLFLETFSFLWRRSTVRIAARWMILFGGLLAVPTALSGLDALQDVFDNGGIMPDPTWALLHQHLLLTSIGAGVAAITVTIAMGLSDRWRGKLYYPFLLALIAAAGLMTFGSHFGGEGVYLKGVAVKLSGHPAAGIEWWAPARSIHVLVAGLGVAMSLGALGASLRVLSTYRSVEDEVQAERELEALTTATAPAGTIVGGPRRVTDDISVARTLNADAVVPALPRVPSSRFWLLASLLFLVTLGFGVWLLISVENTDFDRTHASARTIGQFVWDTAAITKQSPLQNRRGAHVALGFFLVIMPLLLAMAVRWMAKAKWVVATLCLLMVLMIAGEIWLGVLLLYKGTGGPVYKFLDTSDTAAAVILF